MENGVIKLRLTSLTPRELEVLGLLCKGLNYAQIAERLVVTRRAVRAHTSNLIKKLGLRDFGAQQRKRMLLDDVCPVLEEGDIEPSPDEPDEIIDQVLTSEEEELVDQLEYALVKVEPIVINPPRRKSVGERPQRRGLFLLVGGLIGGILITIAILAGIGIVDLPGSGNQEVPTLEEVAQLAASQEPAHTPPPIESATPFIEASNTPQPSPTNPPPTPPPAQAVLFEDDFERGLSPAWQVVSGNPIVVNGMLSADKDTWLLVGDTGWSNYEVLFEADAADCWFSWSENALAVYVQDLDDMVAIKWADCESYWYTVRNGSWKEVPNSEFGPGYEMLSLRILARDGQFAVYVDGLKMTSFFDASFSGGRIALMIAKNTLIDNFVVRETE